MLKNQESAWRIEPYFMYAFNEPENEIAYRCYSEFEDMLIESEKVIEEKD